jgi:hypothetical protein
MKRKFIQLFGNILEENDDFDEFENYLQELQNLT